MRKHKLMKAMACFMAATMAISSGPFANVTNGVVRTAKAAETAESSLVYFNDFEDGIGEGCTIVGSGQIDETIEEGHINVFHNAVSGQGIRQNYLLLPEDVLENAVTPKGELTISFDVNVGSAVDYFYTPLFSAYAQEPDPDKGNLWPMMVIQSRGIAQVNCNGWTDFTDSENAAGVNTESTEYLDDQAWHKVTVTYTRTKVVYYVDGKIVNEWNFDGSDGHCLDGLLSQEGASQLKYICLGGNQAWDWPDPDPAFMFDNVAIYSSALTASQVRGLCGINECKSIEFVNAQNANVLVEEPFTLQVNLAAEDAGSLVSDPVTASAVNATITEEKLDGNTYTLQIVPTEEGAGSVVVACGTISAVYYFNAVKEMEDTEDGYKIITGPTSVPKEIDATKNGWWEKFSDYYALSGDFNISFDIDSQSGLEEWQNPSIVFANTAERESEDYKEYGVIRSDGDSWGDFLKQNGYGMSVDWDSEEYRKAIMADCEIKANVVRAGNELKVYLRFWGKNGKYGEITRYFTIDAQEEIYIFLTTDSASMTINSYSGDLIERDMETEIGYGTFVNYLLSIHDEAVTKESDGSYTVDLTSLFRKDVLEESTLTVRELGRSYNVFMNVNGLLYCLELELVDEENVCTGFTLDKEYVKVDLNKWTEITADVKGDGEGRVVDILTAKEKVTKIFDTALPENIGVCFSVDNSYLEMESVTDNTTGETIELGYIVGADDYSTELFGDHSDAFIMGPQDDITVEFINHGDGNELWNNYILRISNEEEFGSENSELYQNLRPDAYEWGYVRGIEKTVNYEYDWDGNDLISIMKDARVVMNIQRDGDSIVVDSEITPVGEETTYHYKAVTEFKANEERGCNLYIGNAYRDGVNKNRQTFGFSASKTGKGSILVSCGAVGVKEIEYECVDNQCEKLEAEVDAETIQVGDTVQIKVTATAGYEDVRLWEDIEARYAEDLYSVTRNYALVEDVPGRKVVVYEVTPKEETDAGIMFYCGGKAVFVPVMTEGAYGLGDIIAEADEIASFDFGTSGLKDSISGNTAVLTGETITEEAVRTEAEYTEEGALKLDGKYGIKLPESAVPKGESYIISYTAKVNESRKHTPQIFLADRDTVDNYINIGQGWQEAGNFMVWSHNADEGLWGDSIAGQIQQAGEWHTYTVVVNGNEANIYCDGSFVYSDENCVYINDGNSDLYLGVNAWDTPFTGEIKDLAVYDLVTEENRCQDIQFEMEEEEAIAEVPFAMDVIVAGEREGTVTESITASAINASVEITRKRGNRYTLSVTPEKGAEYAKVTVLCGAVKESCSVDVVENRTEKLTSSIGDSIWAATGETLEFEVVAEAANPANKLEDKIQLVTGAAVILEESQEAGKNTAKVSVDVKEGVNTLVFTCGQKELTVEITGEKARPITEGAIAVSNAIPKEIDGTEGFWTDWSDYYVLTGDFDITLEMQMDDQPLKNNYENPIYVFATPFERDSVKYKEYAAVRSDAWGWTAGTTEDNKTIEGNDFKYEYSWEWETKDENGEVIEENNFAKIMENAKIRSHITRKGNDFQINSIIYAKDGKEYTYQAAFTTEAEETIALFMTIENRKLTINSFTNPADYIDDTKLPEGVTKKEDVYEILSGADCVKANAGTYNVDLSKLFKPQDAGIVTVPGRETTTAAITLNKNTQNYQIRVIPNSHCASLKAEKVENALVGKDFELKITAEGTVEGDILQDAVTYSAINADVKQKTVSKDKCEYVFTVTPKKAGEASVTMECGSKVLEIPFTVEKRTPEYTLPTNLEATQGQTLKDIKLPAGFTFKDALTTSVGEAGKREFEVVYTPEDTETFKTVTAKVTVTVKAKPQDNTTGGNGNTGTTGGTGSTGNTGTTGGSTNQDSGKEEKPSENTVTETKDDGTKVETVTQEKEDGTKTETVKEEKTDGSKTETVKEEKADGSKTETVKEEKADGSKTETVKEEKKDGSKTETVKEEKADGSKAETVKETKADGSSTEKKEITTADNSASLKTTKETDVNGKTSASAVVSTGSGKAGSVEISKELLLNIAEDDDIDSFVVEISHTTIASADDSKKTTVVNVSIPSVEGVEVDKIVLTKDSIKSAQETGKGLKVNVAAGDKDSETYAVTIPVKQLTKIKDSVESLNVTVNTNDMTAVSKDSDKKKLAKAINSGKANQKKTCVVSVAENKGMENVGLKLTVPVTGKAEVKAGSKVYVYKYNKETGKLEEAANCKQIVSADGNIAIAAASGTDYVLSAKKLTGKNVETIKDNINVSVAKNVVKPGKELKVKVDLPDTVSTKAKFGTEKAEISYSTNNAKVASVSETGVVTTKKKGTAVITTTIKLSGGQKITQKEKITVK